MFGPLTVPKTKCAKFGAKSLIGVLHARATSSSSGTMPTAKRTACSTTVLSLVKLGTAHPWRLSLLAIRLPTRHLLKVRWLGLTACRFPVAENIDEIYAFIDFAFKPENAGPAIDKHGYNSPVLGADLQTGDNYKKNFAEAYPGAALGNLNPWPAEAPWYADVRTEFVNRFQSA